MTEQKSKTMPGVSVSYAGSGKSAVAKKATTYLFAEVELVAVYRLANINCKEFESLLHKFLARAGIDLALADRFGGKVQPREWFLIPLPVIEEVVQRIKDGSISNYVFDVETASIKRRGN